MPSHTVRPVRAIAAATATLVAMAGALGGCGEADPPASLDAPRPSAAPSSTPTTPGPTRTPSRPASVSPGSTFSGRPSAASSSPAETPVRHVVAVSVDGLNPDAIGDLGVEALPAFGRLQREGSGTLDARTEYEMTVTLPNHTGMLTGRPIDPAAGGHGVTVNSETDRSVADFAGEPVASVFDVVHDAGEGTALFASKHKFGLYDHSWPESIDAYTYLADNQALTAAAADRLTEVEPAFTFVHLSGPDEAGHAHGWFSPQYLDAVQAADRDLGTLLDTVAGDPDLADDTVVLVTADHGGEGPGHGNPARAADFTIPFFAWGAGVPAGADLYDLNPARRDPGDSRPPYGVTPPVRNGDLANLATSLLGLGPVPGSVFDRDQSLRVTSRGGE